MEIELFAHDPLNEGFGFVLNVKFQGKVTQQFEMTRDEAYWLLGHIVYTI